MKVSCKGILIGISHFTRAGRRSITKDRLDNRANNESGNPPANLEKYCLSTAQVVFGPKPITFTTSPNK